VVVDREREIERDREMLTARPCSLGLCCAGSEELADEIEATMREVTGGKPLSLL